jgi:teichoic acid transport system ATP-binding protein
MINESAIVLDKITKTYKLYTNPSDRVKETFHPLRKKYHHQFYALQDIKCTIKKGDTVGIIGRNGSGKSTLLQIVCGILQPTSGRVRAEGRISALLELGAGFNPEYTGRQNVFINGAILGLSNREIEDCLHEIEDFAGIGEFIEQPVKTYSSGMYVRLAFAIAINVNPEILIIDEALAVGDISFQAKCFAKFREFQERKITILFVTHAIDLITRYCTKAFLLDRGMIIESGPPKEVVDEYNRMIVNCRDDLIKASAEPKSGNAVEKYALWETRFGTNPNENRYGNGKAEIIEVGIYSAKGEPTQALMHGESYKFMMKVGFNEPIHDPVFAYTIKDVKGFEISGTNTFYQNIETGRVDKEELQLVTFRQKMLLNPGGYLISFGCAGFENGEYVVYERRYDAIVFEVVSERQSVGLFDLDSNIEIRKIAR